MKNGRVKCTILAGGDDTSITVEERMSIQMIVKVKRDRRNE